MARRWILFLLALLLFGGIPARAVASGEVRDFVVAVVDDEVVSRYDCEVAWRILGGGVAPAELIDRLVDRRLLAAEGRRFGLADEAVAKVDEASVEARYKELQAAGRPVERAAVRRWMEEEAIIRAFEQVRIDPFVRVEPRAKRAAYEAAPERFGNRSFYEVEEEIGRELRAQAHRQRLAEVVAALRSRAHITRPTHPLPLALDGAKGGPSGG